MEKMEEILRDWRQLPQRMIEIDQIKKDHALQPRAERLVRFKDRKRLDDSSQNHIARMHAFLDAGKDQQLEPVLLASYDDGLHLVDGHHRLEAYGRAGRLQVPARVFTTTKKHAVMVSKLVNVGDLKLPMDKEQARDACWQFIAHMTNRGQCKAGVSIRALAGLFGVAKGTVEVMLAAVARVSLDDFGPAALDPGTGWPRWKDVKGNAWKGGLAAMSPEQHRQWKAEKLAKKLGAMLDSEDPAVFADAIQLLTGDAKDSARESVLSDIRKWSDFHATVTY